jgi:hypothetical protein
MIWDVTYRCPGEMLLRFATVEGENEPMARHNFHKKFQDVFIKLICKKEKSPPYLTPNGAQKSTT